jgi:hypothetical protein
VPQAKRGTLLSLVPVDPVPDSIFSAVLAELKPWVDAFRKRHAHLWPAPGTGAQGPAGSYRRRYPWPTCWAEHPALLLDLTHLRSWTLALEAGDLAIADTYGGDFDRWMRHVEEVTGTIVQVISRVCMAGGIGIHSDMSGERRGGAELEGAQSREATGRPDVPLAHFRGLRSVKPRGEVPHGWTLS